jgi:hypothetical protein
MGGGDGEWTPEKKVFGQRDCQEKRNKRKRNNKKEKIEIENFTKKTLISDMSLYLTDSACHVSLTMGLHVRNCVKPGKNKNQCTLKRIFPKLMVFCNFAQY